MVAGHYLASDEENPLKGSGRCDHVQMVGRHHSNIGNWLSQSLDTTIIDS